MHKNSGSFHLTNLWASFTFWYRLDTSFFLEILFWTSYLEDHLEWNKSQGMKHNNVKRIDSVLIRNRVTVIGLAVKVKQIKTMELKVTAMFFLSNTRGRRRNVFLDLVVMETHDWRAEKPCQCLDEVFVLKLVKTRIYIILHKRKNETF